MSSRELTRIMVCRYFVMGRPPVSEFMAAWPPGLSRSADTTMRNVRRSATDAVTGRRGCASIGATFPEERRHESRRPARAEPAADDRGCHARKAEGARGAAAHGLCRVVPQRPAFHRGTLSASDAMRARPRVGGDRRGGRRGRQLCPAGRSRYHLPVGVLRHLRAMRHRPPQSMRGHQRQDVAGRRPAHELEGRRAYEPVPQSLVFWRADAGARELDGEDRPGSPARRCCLGGLRRDDRGRRGVQRRQGRAGVDGRGDRLRRGRAVRRQRRGARRRRAHHHQSTPRPQSSSWRRRWAPPTRSTPAMSIR